MQFAAFAREKYQKIIPTLDQLVALAVPKAAKYPAGQQLGRPLKSGNALQAVLSKDSTEYWANFASPA